MTTITLEDRFWAKVDRSGDCWVWSGYRNREGYGYLGCAEVSNSPVEAHRMAWILSHGPIPKAMCVCHRCDNRGCVRPDHLFLGSHAENMRDMVRKGRAGDGGTGVAVSDEAVLEARVLYSLGVESQSQIADRLGVTRSAVARWLHGEIRVDAGGPITRPRLRIA